MPLSFLPYDATSTARLRGGGDLEYDPFKLPVVQGENENGGQPAETGVPQRAPGQ